LTWSHLVAVLRSPQAVDRETAMPEPHLSDDELRAIASALWQARAATIDDVLATTANPGDADRGRRQFTILGCAACHPHSSAQPLPIAAMDRRLPRYAATRAARPSGNDATYALDHTRTDRASPSAGTACTASYA
jgi:hypothetical protein